MRHGIVAALSLVLVTLMLPAAAEAKHHHRHHHRSLASKVAKTKSAPRIRPSDALLDSVAAGISAAAGIERAAQSIKTIAHNVAASAGFVAAKSGARAHVSAVFGPKAQCVVDRLEAARYRIKDLGGYGERPHNASAHPTGNAMDVNQCGRDCTSPRMSRSLASDIARACQVTSGGDWTYHYRNGHRYGRGPDLGHFEMLHSYGYVGGSHRYAGLHHGHRYAALRHHRHHGWRVAALHRLRHVYLQVRRRHHRRRA